MEAQHNFRKWIGLAILVTSSATAGSLTAVPARGGDAAADPERVAEQTGGVIQTKVQSSEINAAGFHAHASTAGASVALNVKKLTPELSQVHIDSGPFIDGAQAPELIPDEVAYSLFLRMLLERYATEDDNRRHRAYVKHVLRTGAALADRRSELNGAAREEDVTAVLQFVVNYGNRLKSVDGQGAGSRDQAMPVVRDIVESMPTHLGQRLAADVDRYVKTKFKRGVKIIQ